MADAREQRNIPIVVPKLNEVKPSRPMAAEEERIEAQIQRLLSDKKYAAAATVQDKIANVSALSHDSGVVPCRASYGRKDATVGGQRKASCRRQEIYGSGAFSRAIDA